MAWAAILPPVGHSSPQLAQFSSKVAKDSSFLLLSNILLTYVQV